MRKMIALSILILLSSAGVCFAGSTFRCGPYVVSVGATKPEVLGKCGEPTSKEYLGEQTSRGVHFKNKRTRHQGQEHHRDQGRVQ